MNPILMYHYVGDVPVEGTHGCLTVPTGEFAGQLESLSAWGYRSVLSGEVDAGLGGEKGRRIWLTFDDGRIDNHEVALPALKRHGHRASFLVVAGECLGGRPGYMPVSALRELVAEGMEVGSHTMTHPRLAKLDAEACRREVTESRERLEEALQVPVRAFAYPYGSWSPGVVEAVRGAGYGLAVSTIRGNRNGEADRWLLKRVMVQPGRTGARLRYSLSPLYDLLHGWKNRGRWKAG